MSNECQCGKCKRNVRIHDLKIKPEYFKSIVNGTKTFETRFNDRHFKVGDLLQLREFDNKGYTGKYIFVEVIYILDDPQFCKEHYITMSIKVRLDKTVVL